MSPTQVELGDMRIVEQAAGRAFELVGPELQDVPAGGHLQGGSSVLLDHEYGDSESPHVSGHTLSQTGRRPTGQLRPALPTLTS